MNLREEILYKILLDIHNFIFFPGMQPLYQHPVRVWSGTLVPPPHTEILGQTYSSGTVQGILWHPVQRVLWGDPGGPTIYQNIQCGSRCSPITLVHGDGIDVGGIGTCHR